MSRRAAFDCEHCRMPLGEYVQGGLRLLGHGETILGPDRAGITCPRCQRVRCWSYSPQTTAMTSLAVG